ncbi:hypothetical protein HZH66_010125 [Vespula vulgaris]|uniref:Uncharacterized protein n=1 Tax=Vespula vulgaris TaxID=7454 RepID=A0A834JIE8_VESVU|nr:hypothetical protein HZH66_010125 [Vespula vulgaris]
MIRNGMTACHMVSPINPFTLRFLVVEGTAAGRRKLERNEPRSKINPKEADRVVSVIAKNPKLKEGLMLINGYEKKLRRWNGILQKISITDRLYTEQRIPKIDEQICTLQFYSFNLKLQVQRWRL